MLQGECETRDTDREDEARDAAARRRLRIGDHEEREEEQAARLELVQQYGAVTPSQVTLLHAMRITQAGAG